METSPTTRETPLAAVHTELGATMTDFAGWRMPLRYTSEREEHQAVRTRAGLFDLSHMGEVTVLGPEAAPALDAALIGDISGLAVGRARYTMICAEDGGVLDDLIVYRTGGNEYLVVANAANTDVVVHALTERAAGYDAEVRDDRERYALIAVQGPAAAGIVAEVCDAELEALRYYAAVPATVLGRAVLLARTGYTGEDGFELFCAPGDAEALWRGLLERGAGAGLVPAGLSCRDTLRLEAGMPLYGHELNRSTTPFDAGLGRTVRFDKAGGGVDFVGRAALERIAAEGPGRALVGLRTSGRRVPRAGYAVLDPATGEPVGEVTSGAPSPTLGEPIAMAYVPPAMSHPDTVVAIDVRGRPEEARVVPLPFYQRRR
ncbi:glycine cleavage system aminomethyltransferase GcvT [Allostreptomyces psammosilenae]|uniref:Aminomethyltransferase n=1 Tax=Allostreptomyces psammosilenae TaxID=1892865 RepID=A0A853A7W6_9ACTN|nr:glycine cleavage system aminomethyltransferase GcvT [Allostreptomyces psammosilenae]NYI06532.1 aminomethyltransferase [Allostreptomyces psammosilenae]